jgi:phytoene dehydrogenase-like protein
VVRLADQCDVLVVGAGPAGRTAAQLLGSCGWSVVLVMRDALVVPGCHAPLQFAAGVNLPALARLATACGEVPALIAAYNAQIGPVPLTGLLTGLSLLVARYALVAETSRS